MAQLQASEKKAWTKIQARIASYEKDVQKILAQTLVDMRKEMAGIYAKYATGGKLTRVEMTRYNKYTTMEKQILKLLDPAISKTIKDVKRIGSDIYHESFFQYAWAMDNGNGVRLAYGPLPEKAIAATFDVTNPKNIELMEALKNYGPKAKQWIRSALLKGLVNGKGYADMVRDLKGALDKTAWQLLRILRTEGQRALNLAQYDVYAKARDKGINGTDVWVATKDAKTRDTHGRADGQKRGKDGKFNVGKYKALYPLDPALPAEESINCRCTLRFEVEGYEPVLMRTREQGIIPYQTYEDWRKEYHPDWTR